MMGYDVAVTTEGMKILEINSLPTMLPQIYQPYMQLPAVARFFQKRMPNLSRISRPQGVAAAHREPEAAAMSDRR